MNAQIDALLAWRRGERPGPYRLHVVLTERCNLHCLSCFMGQTLPHNREREVPDDRLVALIEDALRLGTREIYLVGGEVFVRKKLTLALMEKIKREGVLGDLTTNGTLLDDETARRIVEMGWDRLQVSLDGPTAEINDHLRPPAGSFDRVVAGVRRLNDWKARLGATAPLLTLSTVLSNRNHHALVDLVHLAGDLGFSGVSVQSLKDQMSPLAPSLMLAAGERAEVREVVRAAVPVAAGLGLDTNLENLLESPIIENIGRLDRVMREDIHDVEDPFFRAHCFVPWSTLVVHWDGRVSPCWEWRGDGMGDVRSQGLEDIWYGEMFERFRREFRAKQVSAHCAQCCLGFLNNTRWLREMGLMAAGNHGEALVVAERLLASAPFHHQSVEVKARALYHLGRHEEARAWIRGVVESFPPAVLGQLAHLLDVPGEFEDFGTLGEVCDLLLARVGPACLDVRGRRLLPPAAFALARVGRYQESLAMCERFDVLAAPSPRQVWQAKLISLYGLRRTDQARETLRALAEEARGGRARELEEVLWVPYSRGDPRGCCETAEAFAVADPGCALARGLRGACRVRLGDPRTAVEDIAYAVEVHPEDRVLRGVHLVALYRSGRSEEARRVLDACEVGGPDSHLPRLLAIAAEEGDWPAVLECIEARARTIGPRGADAHLMTGALAGAYAAAWACTLAAGSLDLAARLLPHAEGAGVGALQDLVRALADASYSAGRRTDARRLLLGACLQPWAPLRVRAEALYVAHKNRDPRTVIRGANSLLAEGPDAYASWVRAAALAKLGRLDEARSGCQDALEALAGRSSDFVDAIWDTLAGLAERAGDPAAASVFATRALELNPDRPAARRTSTRARRRLLSRPDLLAAGPKDPLALAGGAPEGSGALLVP